VAKGTPPSNGAGSEIVGGAASSWAARVLQSMAADAFVARVPAIRPLSFALVPPRGG
jgi:hypothetical protein